jgi:hypothetical protein
LLTVKHYVKLDGDAVLLHCCWPSIPSSANGVNRWAHDGMDFLLPGEWTSLPFFIFLYSSIHLIMLNIQILCLAIIRGQWFVRVI